MRFLYVLVALLLAMSPAAAHPHIFIDAEATIVFDESGAMSGIRHAWTFDEAFSAWQIQGLDVNGDGITSTEEMQELADENMTGLGEYQYYTFAGEGEGNLTFDRGSNPSFTSENGRSTLRFEIGLSTPYHIRERLEIAVNDPEYYVAITFADASAVTLENAPAGCAATLDPPEEMSPELADLLYSLPPEVTELPPELATALRGVQGAIVITCPGGVQPAATAAEAVNAVGTSQAQPFGGPPPEPGFALPRTGFLGWVAETQKNFYLGLQAALSRLKADGNAFWILGGLSFLYGVFHAAGPGHGKVVISSYVLANEQQVRRGVLLSFLAAMLQSAVAIAFVLVAAAVLHLSSAVMDDMANWIGIASYALVVLLGLWLIARKLFGFGHRHDHGHDHHHHDDHDHHHEHDHHEHEDHDHRHIVTPAEVRGDWREQLAVVLGVGLRPCSGALVVLVFALSQDLLPAGIAAVVLMGLGTAITVAVLATLAVAAKGWAGRLSGASGGAAAVAVWWLELAGAVAVLAFGLILLLASI